MLTYRQQPTMNDKWQCKRTFSVHFTAFRKSTPQQLKSKLSEKIIWFFNIEYIAISNLILLTHKLYRLMLRTWIYSCPSSRVTNSTWINLFIFLFKLNRLVKIPLIHRSFLNNWSRYWKDSDHSIIFNIILRHYLLFLPVIYIWSMYSIKTTTVSPKLFTFKCVQACMCICDQIISITPHAPLYPLNFCTSFRWMGVRSPFKINASIGS